jgi:transcriptional regulator with XRE-family HTH domain
MKSDVTQILQVELSRRCQTNPRYSLRAFARTLGVSPANLSLILNRKRTASARTIARMLARLELGAVEREVLSGKSVEVDLNENFDLKVFEQVSSWLSYSVLSLIKTKDFRPDERWIAKRLAVTVHEVKASIAALRETGLLNGWKRTKNNLRLNNAISTAVTRAFQRQLVERAMHSMENDPPSERDIRSITFAMSRERFEEAQEEIRQFRLRMAKIFEAPGKSTDVYHLTVQLVPATKGV